MHLNGGSCLLGAPTCIPQKLHPPCQVADGEVPGPPEKNAAPVKNFGDDRIAQWHIAERHGKKKLDKLAGMAFRKKKGYKLLNQIDLK
jgi:hypothetical protein